VTEKVFKLRVYVQKVLSLERESEGVIESEIGENKSDEFASENEVNVYRRLCG